MEDGTLREGTFAHACRMMELIRFPGLVLKRTRESDVAVAASRVNALLQRLLEPLRRRPKKLLDPLRRYWASILLIIVPMVLAAIYYGLIISDIYISESQFVIRQQEKNKMPSSLGMFLQSAGMVTLRGGPYPVTYPRKTRKDRGGLHSFRYRPDGGGSVVFCVVVDAMAAPPGDDALNAFVVHNPALSAQERQQTGTAWGKVTGRFTLRTMIPGRPGQPEDAALREILSRGRSHSTIPRLRPRLTVWRRLIT